MSNSMKKLIALFESNASSEVTTIMRCPQCGQTDKGFDHHFAASVTVNNHGTQQGEIEHGGSDHYWCGNSEECDWNGDQEETLS